MSDSSGDLTLTDNNSIVGTEGTGTLTIDSLEPCDRVEPRLQALAYVCPRCQKQLFTEAEVKAHMKLEHPYWAAKLKTFPMVPVQCQQVEYTTEDRPDGGCRFNFKYDHASRCK